MMKNNLYYAFLLASLFVNFSCDPSTGTPASEGPNELLEAKANGMVSASGYDADAFVVEAAYVRPESTVIQNIAIDTSEAFGIWAQSLDSLHADFWLTAKSFFVADYDGDGHMPYLLDGNKITVFYEGFAQEGIITSTGSDVLKIKWEGSSTESVYLRFVN